MPAINRKFKDTLFRMLFVDKNNLLSLYNALNKSHYTDINLLEINTIENVIYISYKNDLSFLIYDELWVVEHQSTVNPNMPLRSLFYFSRLYEKIVDTGSKSIYGKDLIKIPTPHSIVLYNGYDIKPDKEILKLSDSFINEDNSGNFEWTTTVYNINKGNNSDLLDTCHILDEYSFFVDKVKQNRKIYPTDKEAIEKAIDECIKKGILADFLRKHRAEVLDVCLTEFDQEKYDNTVREEGFKKGREEGESIGEARGESNKEKEMILSMHKEGLDNVTIARIAKCTSEYVQQIIDNNHK